MLTRSQTDKVENRGPIAGYKTLTFQEFLASKARRLLHQAKRYNLSTSKYLLSSAAKLFAIFQTSVCQHLIEPDVLITPDHDPMNLIPTWAVHEHISRVLQAGCNLTLHFIQILQALS